MIGSVNNSVQLGKYRARLSWALEPLRKIVNKYNGCKTADISREWEDLRAMAAYTAVKIALCQPPVLRFPDFSKPFIVLVDATGGFGEATGGYGACLAQMDDSGHERPIAYASTALNSVQQKFGSTQAELRQAH